MRHAFYFPAFCLLWLGTTSCPEPTASTIVDRGGDAAPAEELWIALAAGPGIDHATALALAADESFLVAGWYGPEITFARGEEGETSLTAAGRENGFVARYDPTGVFSWAKSIDGSGDTRMLNVTVAVDGSVAVAGALCIPSSTQPCDITFGAGEPTETRLASLDRQETFVARYQADGRFAWVRRLPNTPFDNTSVAVAVLSDGSILFASAFGGTVTFDPGGPLQTTMTSQQNSDLVLARFAPDGTFIWSRQIASDYGVGAQAISVYPDDSAVLVGSYCHLSRSGALPCAATFWTGEPEQRMLDSVGGRDLFAARVDSNGGLTWLATAGSQSEDNAHAATLVPDGAVLLTGAYCTPGDMGTCVATFGEGPNAPTLSGAGAGDTFVAEIDATGGWTWARGVRGGPYTGTDAGWAVTVSEQDEVVIFGKFSGPVVFGEGAAETTLTTDVIESFLAAYDRAGDLLWAKRLGSIPAWRGGGVAAKGNGTVLVAGSFFDTATFMPSESFATTRTSVGDSDVFVLELPTQGL